MKVCPECKSTMPDRAKFCPNCGAPQFDVKDAPIEKIIFDIHEPIEKQFTEQFFLALKSRVHQEHQSHQFQAFSERVYESGFRDTVARRAVELQEEIDGLLAQNRADYRRINQEADLMFEDMLDYFIIRFCPDLTELDLPESILKHQYSNSQKSSIKNLIYDYLDFENEKERVYTDLMKMPIEKFTNAGKSYLFPAKDEAIWFVCDTTIFGNGKEGFSMTDTSLYWRMPLQKARKINYQSVQEIEREQEWLKINGQFFHINPSINLKMLKLLKKIKQWGY